MKKTAVADQSIIAAMNERKFAMEAPDAPIQ
jgi:hypothetical protein